MNKKKSSKLFLIAIIWVLIYFTILFGSMKLIKIYGNLPIFILGLTIYVIGVLAGGRQKK